MLQSASSPALEVATSHQPHPRHLQGEEAMRPGLLPGEHDEYGNEEEDHEYRIGKGGIWKQYRGRAPFRVDALEVPTPLLTLMYERGYEVVHVSDLYGVEEQQVGQFRPARPLTQAAPNVSLDAIEDDRHHIELTHGESEAPRSAGLASKRKMDESDEAAALLEDLPPPPPQEEATSSSSAMRTGVDDRPRSTNVDERARRLQGRMMRVLKDANLSQTARVDLMDEIDITLNDYDVKGVKTPQQVDPNRVVVREDGTFVAMCAVCQRTRSLSDASFWSKGNKHALERRLDSPQDTTRTARKCLECGTAEGQAPERKTCQGHCGQSLPRGSFSISQWKSGNRCFNCTARAV